MSDNDTKFGVLHTPEVNNKGDLYIFYKSIFGRVGYYRDEGAWGDPFPLVTDEILRKDRFTDPEKAYQKYLELKKFHEK